MKVVSAELAAKLAEAQLNAAREEMVSARKETVSAWKEAASANKTVAVQAEHIVATGRKLRACEQKLASMRKATAAAVARPPGEKQGRVTISEGQVVQVNNPQTQDDDIYTCCTLSWFHGEIRSLQVYHKHDID